MAAIPLALSIHHFISSVGADAGFAAIIGLALLVLLFFAQARETANLRRRADEAESELQALAMYVQQLARTPAPPPAPTTSAPVAAPPAAARIAARPAAAPVASRAVVPEPAGALATIPAAPAGVGAPALSSATRLIPLADEISIRALHGSSNGHAEPEENGTATATLAAPEPATVPPGPPPSTAAGGNGVPRVPPPPSAGITNDAPPPPRVAPRPPGAPVSRPSFTPPPRSPARGRRVSRGAMFVLAALLLAVVIVGVFVLTNSGGGGASPSSSSSAAASRTPTSSQSAGKHGRHSKTTTAAPVKVVPSTVTVAVLNGTSTTNLAADVMTKLTGAGYKAGQTANAPPASQSLQSTIVGYTQPADRNDALAVAKSLNLGSASVQGVNPADQSAACSQTPTNCPAQVVVTVGSDLASAA
jgi:hypothetical protein